VSVPRRNIFSPPNRAANVAPAKFDPTKPILAFDPSTSISQFSATEQGTILAAFQQLTNDKLTQTGLQIFSDGQGSGGSLPKGTALLRAAQSPNPQVLVHPSPGTLPETRPPQGGDPNIYLELDFSPLRFFTLDALTFLTRMSTAMLSNPPPYTSHVEVVPLSIVLAHELVHVMRILRRTTVARTSSNTVTNLFRDESGWAFSELVFTEEANVIGLFNAGGVSENGIRSEQGLNLRIAMTTPSFTMGAAPGVASPVTQGARPIPDPVTNQLFPSWWPDYPSKGAGGGSTGATPPPSQ
jgi:hypothetical protein